MSRSITIVNEQDEVIGYKESDALGQADIYRVTALWLTNSQGQILLAQRSFNMSHDPGKWGPAVAGTVEEGETYDSNIVKEIGEEIGLTGVRPAKGPKRRYRGEHNYFAQWYTLAADKPAAEFILQEEEVEQVKWFDTDELARELRENSEDYLEGLNWPLENISKEVLK